MEKTYTIKISISGKVKAKHIEFVEEQAFERAFEMIQQGYYSGSICVLLFNGDKTANGWWSVSKD